ncbi:MAG TPA: hypothetical protein VKX34_00540, partial [Aequorivita sp.]|nr:hypothetical protein [Aequorivita sp.]
FKLPGQGQKKFLPRQFSAKAGAKIQQVFTCTNVFEKISQNFFFLKHLAPTHLYLISLLKSLSGAKKLIFLKLAIRFYTFAAKLKIRNVQ